MQTRGRAARGRLCGGRRPAGRRTGRPARWLHRPPTRDAADGIASADDSPCPRTWNHPATGVVAFCESAEYSPSPGGEGRDEGGLPPRTADFPVCCIAGFPTRRPSAHRARPISQRPADWKVGGTADKNVCATSLEPHAACRPAYRRLPSLPYRGFPNPQTVRPPDAPDFSTPCRLESRRNGRLESLRYGFGTAHRLPSGVPQTSQSAVSRVSQPADRPLTGRVRFLNALPIGKSAIRQVGKPAVRPYRSRVGGGRHQFCLPGRLGNE